MKVISKHKRARFDYEILKVLEAGLVLLGTEIKSIREHRVSLMGSFISVREGEAWWKGGSIASWECAGKNGHIEHRDRKLLLKKSEIKTLEKALNEKTRTVLFDAMQNPKKAMLLMKTLPGSERIKAMQILKDPEIARQMSLYAAKQNE